MAFSIIEKNRHNLYLLFFSIVIGLLSACGALLFRSLIELFQYLFWGSGPVFTNKILSSPWYMILMIPTVGGIAAGFIISFWVPEAKGPGVPEIIKSVTLGHSYIRHRVTFLKALVTSLLIGTGASVGREGPIAQIGASVGSSLSQVFRLPQELRRVCLAAGAAAGIAATFNAPIAGTFFAIEIILLDIEITYISHIIISSIVASVFSRIFWGDFPAFKVGAFQILSYWELLVYLVLGISAAAISIAFVKILFFTQDVFDRLIIPDWIKPGMGGLGLGIMALWVPQVMGVGYDTINLALAGKLGFKFAAVLFVFKMTATCLSIGSGMSGGILAPSLFLGATIGTCIGILANLFFPGFLIDPVFYALAGMGAVVAGTTLAPITAILTIFELTYNYHVILPLMVACISSSLIVRFFFGYSVYEMKLLKQGINIVRGHDVNILRLLRVEQYITKDFESVSQSAPLMKIVDQIIISPYPHFVVLNPNEELVGVLSLRDIKSSMKDFDDLKEFIIATDLMSPHVVAVLLEDTLELALSLFEKHQISFLPVMDHDKPKRVVGILKKDTLLQAYEERVLKDRILSQSFKSTKPV